jgi:hypothetical protein
MRIWQCGQYATPASKVFRQSEQVMVGTSTSLSVSHGRVDVSRRPRHSEDPGDRLVPTAWCQPSASLRL